MPMRSPARVTLTSSRIARSAMRRFRSIPPTVMPLYLPLDDPIGRYQVTRALTRVLPGRCRYDRVYDGYDGPCGLLQAARSRPEPAGGPRCAAGGAQPDPRGRADQHEPARDERGPGPAAPPLRRRPAGTGRPRLRADAAGRAHAPAGPAGDRAGRGGAGGAAGVRPRHQHAAAFDLAVGLRDDRAAGPAAGTAAPPGPVHGRRDRPAATRQ